MDAVMPPGRERMVAGIDDLPDLLDYSGEFGPELVLFLPFVRWLSRVGALRRRRIGTYTGMRCFYDDLDCAGIVEKEELRRYVPPYDRPPYWPVRDEHSFDGLGRPARHLYPDLRRLFATAPLPRRLRDDGRPIAVVHNKHNVEWRSPPRNHLTQDALDRIFTALSPRFSIVYIRHHAYAADRGFSFDDSPLVPYEDRTVLDDHPEVACFDEIVEDEAARGGGAINPLKNAIFSRCHHFITAQGGGAHHMALFSGAALLVLHREGSELRWAYADGYYGFMATPAPLRLICRGEAELIDALPAFAATTVRDGQAVPPPGAAAIERLSPWTAGRRPATFP